MTDYEQVLGWIKRFKLLRYEEIVHDPYIKPSGDPKDCIKVIKVMDGDHFVFFEFDLDGNILDDTWQK